MVVVVGRRTDAIFAAWRVRAWNMGLLYLLIVGSSSALLWWLQRREKVVHRQLLATDAALHLQQTRLDNLAQNVPGMLYQLRVRADREQLVQYSSEGIRDVYEAAPRMPCTMPVWCWSAFARRLRAGGGKRCTFRPSNSALWSDGYRVILPRRGERWLARIPVHRRWTMAMCSGMATSKM